MKQTSLVFDRPQPVKTRHYLDLSINERINLKANSCGFQSVWLNHSLPMFRKYLGFLGRYDHPECLMPNWFWHHKTNNNRIQPPKMTLF